MAKEGLALVFGAPKGGGMSREMGEGPESEMEYPPGFEDACEAAFDAIRAKDSREFCRQLYEAFWAYERAPHEEAPHEEYGEGEEE